MIKNFRIYLTLIMISFSVLISLSVAFIDQVKVKRHLIEEHNIKLQLVEDTILNSLHTIDKAYNMFDKETTEKMRQYSEALLSLYKTNSNFDMWDFDALKEKFGMDVFIINKENIITHSSLKEDINLDFKSCCDSFSKLLDMRRNGETFVYDGMDLHQKSGEFKKYSYMPTPDHKYIIELGVSLSNKEILNEFNFTDVIDSLEKQYTSVDEIHVYVPDGFILGEKIKNGEIVKLSKQKEKVFRNVVKSGKEEEFTGILNGKETNFRYIPYEYYTDNGSMTHRIVEIAYNKGELNSVLNDYRKDFLIHLFIILTAAIILSFIIARIVARPMYLAFHDSLTGLKNRAAFEQTLKGLLRRRESNVALMMVDLDNFKLVNDKLGHGKGDVLLTVTAKVIQACAGKQNLAARLGGDEFAIIFSNTNMEEIISISNKLIAEMNKLLLPECDLRKVDVTVSIGIAFANDDDNMQMLYEKADTVLYESKRKGKNQYQIYA
ncbi:GGDEF domain-containing protein [Metabacillus fastidiosus]|nr:GGDEF domain-containing protein [Metabacillus fastidiosus]MED4461299.1 GGDEF domain-containing protein [Metabacillus fastidiosus]